MLCKPGSIAGVCLALAMSAHTTMKGIQCSDHPLYRPGFKGELIRSWNYGRNNEFKLYFTDSGYIPRYNQHTWAPVHFPGSTKYKNLDFFASYLSRDAPDDYITLHFQRKAKVYLLAGSRYEEGAKVTLPGWESEEWVKMVKSKANIKAKMGIANEMSFHVNQYAFVFTQEPTREITLPSVEWVRKHIRGIKTNGYYTVLVAEADGKPVRKPIPPQGAEVVAGGRCPKELHDSWRTAGTDLFDKQTKNMTFATHHPLWDPCYWCGYDHEHGSSAKHLMGYEPKFGYVALKNRNEPESHNGFKGLVLDTGKYLVYYGLHMHMSHPRRFFARHHSAVFAVVDAKTKDLLLELAYKADFGFVATRLKKGGHFPLRKKDKELFQRQTEKLVARGMRVVNVINPGKLDKRFMYRTKGGVLKGEYEQWVMQPLCSRKEGLREPVVDIKDPLQALRTANSDENDTIILGGILHGKFKRHVGVNRDFRVHRLVISKDYCAFILPDGWSMPADGVFYTDVYGKRIMKGPGRHAVRQFIKPGFFMNITGVWMVDDTWLGLHKRGVMGGMRDITYSVDPMKN